LKNTNGFELNLFIAEEGELPKRLRPTSRKNVEGGFKKTEEFSFLEDVKLYVVYKSLAIFFLFHEFICN
jgi:hypothetical protein